MPGFELTTIITPDTNAVDYLTGSKLEKFWRDFRLIMINNEIILINHQLTATNVPASDKLALQQRLQSLATLRTHTQWLDSGDDAAGLPITPVPTGAEIKALGAASASLANYVAKTKAYVALAKISGRFIALARNELPSPELATTIAAGAAAPAASHT